MLPVDAVSAICKMNTKAKRLVKVNSGDEVFVGELTQMQWDFDQWAFMVNGKWYNQSEVKIHMPCTS